MNNKALLGALALDLKRVAIGYHRGSTSMALRFYDEALKRRSELNQKELKSYIRKILSNLDELSHQKDKTILAETALMYSTLLQNAAI